MPVLAPEQVDFFNANGYLILPKLIKPEEVSVLQREADYLLEHIMNSSIMHKRRSGRLDWCMTKQGVQMVRKVQPINDLSLAFAQTIRDERIVAPLRELMGDGPRLMEEKLNYKQPLPQRVDGLKIPTIDDYFPIHNDWAYYKVNNYPQSILSSALFLDDCTPDNGPIRVWPGTHKTHVEHRGMERGLEVLPGVVDRSGGVDVTGPAGSFVIFHSLLLHDSRPNTSGRPRRVMIYSHYPRSFAAPHDARNGYMRLRESPFEREYLRARLRGDYHDTFAAPAYTTGHRPPAGAPRL